MEVPADREPRGLEDRQHDLAGRVRVRGRLEHDQMAGAQPLGDPLDRADHDRQVRLALLRQGRRQRDQDRVRLRDRVVVGRRRQPCLQQLLQLLGGHVLDVALAAHQLVDAGLDHIDQHGRAAGLDEHLRERHADVAGADDGDLWLHARERLQRRALAIFSEACPSP